MMITREYRPVALPPGAAPVKVTVAINFVQFDFPNPYMSMRSTFSQLRIEDVPFAGFAVARVTGEATKDQWWHVSLTREDGAELRALIDQAKAAAASL
jgi:hypothetical protein